MNLENPQKAGTRRATLLRHFAVMLTPIALGGCMTTSPTRIDVEDTHVFIPALRAAFNLNEGKQAASEPQTGHAIEFGLTKAKGGAHQSLGAAQSPLTLNNTTFTPPEQLNNDFNFTFATTSWRWRKFFNDRSLGLEVFAGAGRSSLGLNVSSPTQQASDHFVNWGPQGGLGLIWRFSPSSSLQGRVNAFISTRDSGVNNIFRSEILFAKSFTENLALRAGYASWEVGGDRHWSSNSDFKLTFSGPVLSLDMDFNN